MKSNKIFEVDVQSIQYFGERQTIHVRASTIKEAMHRAEMYAKRDKVVNGTPRIDRIELICTIDA